MLWINSGIFPDIKNTRKYLEIDPSLVIANIIIGRIYVFRGIMIKQLRSLN